MTSGKPGRATGLARALTLSWFAVALSTVAHLAAGGVGPGVASLLAVAAFLTVAGMPLCRSAFRLTWGAPLLVAQQLITHVALSLTSSGQRAPVHPTAQLAAALGNEHAIHSSGAHVQSVASSSGHAAMSGHGLLPSPLMIAAHLCAAVLVAALLTQAEAGWAGVRALQRGRERSGQRLVALVARLACAPALIDLPMLHRRLRRPGRVDSTPPPALTDLWRSPAPCRRGPPRPCAA